MPRNGLPRRPHALLERFDHAGNGDEPLLAVGKGADARQHDPLGRAHVFRVGGHLDLERRAALPRRALEGLGGGMQVPRTVIDDGDVHVGSSLREEPDDLFTPPR